MKKKAGKTRKPRLMDIRISRRAADMLMEIRQLSGRLAQLALNMKEDLSEALIIQRRADELTTVSMEDIIEAIRRNKGKP